MIIKSNAPEQEVSRVAREGRFRYPLIADSRPPAVAPPTDLEEVDKLPPERLSKPYYAQSLAALSDEQLFAFMARRPDSYDFLRDRMREATAVLPAHTVIAQAQPDPYRAKLRERLAGELESSRGPLPSRATHCRPLE